MKTIKQIADELNTTPQNVYTQLKRKNISLKGLKGKKQGKQVFYDEDAERTIKQTFNERVKRDNENNESISAFETLNETLNAEIKRLNDELTAAREAEAAAQEEIARLRQVEEELRHQVSSLIEAERNRTELAKFEAAKKIAAPAEEQQLTLSQRLKYLFKGR